MRFANPTASIQGSGEAVPRVSREIDTTVASAANLAGPSATVIPSPAEDIERALTRAGAVRIDVIDLLRGLVIILMVLDHVRDFFHESAFVFDPTDVSRATPMLFATRWVTHLCAPTFLFLSGVSIFLQRANGKNPRALAPFLLKRGLWLIVLEFTVISFGFNFALPYVFAQVIWAIGAGMVVMAALVWLPGCAVLALGAVIVLSHQLLAGIDATDFDSWGFAWQLVMEPGLIGFLPGLTVYPLVPWLGVMCLGYGLGGVFLQDAAQRRRTLLVLGLTAVASFILLRWINAYGDPAPWTSQPTAVSTTLLFLNVSKYPPSLMYVLVTLGIAMLIALVLERLGPTPQRILLAFGRTPLFTYVAHIYLVHLLAIAVWAIAGHPVTTLVNFLGDPQRHLGVGFSLPLAYLMWLVMLALLYPAAAWFASVKHRRRDAWLSYT